MAKVVVNCEDWKNLCEILKSVVIDGVADDVLKGLGYTPGSPEAERAIDVLWYIYARCCSKIVGHDGPITSSPIPPQPSQPPPPVAAGTLAAPLIIPKLDQILSSLEMCAGRLIPVILLLYISHLIARQTAYEICTLKRTRVTHLLQIMCFYECPSGVEFFTINPFFGIPCPPVFPRVL